MDFDRLKKLAEEPERTAMPRTTQFPNMSTQLLAQKQEIAALRRGLLEAISELEKHYGC